MADAREAKEQARFTVEEKVLCCMASSRDAAIEVMSALGVNFGDVKSIQEGGDVFSREWHRKVFWCCCGMVRLGRYPQAGPDETCEAVATHLQSVGSFSDQFAELAGACVGTVDEARYYTPMLLDMHQRDQYTAAVRKSLGDVEEKPTQEVIDAQVKKLMDLSVGNRLIAYDRFLETWSTGFDTYFDDKRWKAENPGKRRGALSATHDMDDLTGGMMPGSLTVFSADTGRGKTSFAIQCALRNVKEGKPVLFLSQEMPRQPIWERFCSQALAIPLSRFVTGTLTPEDEVRVAELGDKQWPLMLVAGTRMTVAEIMAECHRASYDTPPELVVVDYLQFTRVDPSSCNGNRTLQISGIADSLKEMAMRFNCAVLTLSQVNEMGQARESRGIDHVCDCEMLLTPKLTEMGQKIVNDKRQVLMVLQVRKNRQKSPGSRLLWWDGEHVRFLGLSTREKETFNDSNG